MSLAQKGIMGSNENMARLGNLAGSLPENQFFPVGGDSDDTSAKGALGGRNIHKGLGRGYFTRSKRNLSGNAV